MDDNQVKSTSMMRTRTMVSQKMDVRTKILVSATKSGIWIEFGSDDSIQLTWEEIDKAKKFFDVT